MKQPHQWIFAACLATLVSSEGIGIAAAAEESGVAQELLNMKGSEQVKFARWTQQPDSYVLLVAIDPAWKPTGNTGVVNAPAQVAPQPPAAYAPGTNAAVPDRASFFIGNTIANLRGTDPIFCGRTLTLADGRRVVNTSDSTSPAPPPAKAPATSPSRSLQPYQRAIKLPSVEVWLLKADGTQILPTAYKCDPGPSNPPQPSKLYEISYAYPAAQGAQAVAVAIRVGQDFFIEKLQPPPQPAAAQ